MFLAKLLTSDMRSLPFFVCRSVRLSKRRHLNNVEDVQEHANLGIDQKTVIKLVKMVESFRSLLVWESMS